MSMEDIDRIVLYNKYDIDKKILVPRYAALCSRELTLTYDEGLKLGMETALLIARARECARCKATDSGARTPLPDDFKADDMKSLITDLFDIQKDDLPKDSTLSKDSTSPKEDLKKAGELLDYFLGVKF